MPKFSPMRSRWWLGLMGLLVVASTPLAALDKGGKPTATALQRYVARPEPKFAWTLKEKKAVTGGTVHSLRLVSQEWQGILWEHDLEIYVPTGTTPKETMVLRNTGGGANSRNQLLGMLLAQKMAAPMAILYHSPNQPLLGNKKEDDLISETFLRYMKTKDDSWPLLFPMAKSVVKAMDAVQAYVAQEWSEHPVKKFVVTGESKRGWTTWLTAATGDARVKAIIPVVIDTLNMPKQLPHQLEMFDGKYSEQIVDYTGKGLADLLQVSDGRDLIDMVDPYSYVERYTMPKFIVNGANDRYWTVDALNFYWDDLPNPKWFLNVPNAGHNLQEKVDGKPPSLDRAINGIAAFAKHQIEDKPLPQLSWKHDDANGQHRLTAKSSVKPLGARLWVAHHKTKDFRDAKFEAKPAEINGDGTILATLPPPSDGYAAFYLEMDFAIGDLKYNLSSQVRVVGNGGAK